MYEKKILVIILTYNEEETIEAVIKKSKEFLNPNQILVIDGYSTDKTSSIAKTNGAEIIYIDKKFGIGFWDSLNHSLINIKYLILIKTSSGFLDFGKPLASK